MNYLFMISKYLFHLTGKTLFTATVVTYLVLNCIVEQCDITSLKARCL